MDHRRVRASHPKFLWLAASVVLGCGKWICRFKIVPWRLTLRIVYRKASPIQACLLSYSVLHVVLPAEPRPVFPSRCATRGQLLHEAFGALLCCVKLQPLQAKSCKCHLCRCSGILVTEKAGDYVFYLSSDDGYLAE